MSTAGPVTLASASGLRVQVNANGSLRRIVHDAVIVNAFLGNELEGGPANLFLRCLTEQITFVPLLGPRSPGSICLDETGLTIRGTWSGIRFAVSLRLAESAPAWFWHVTLENAGSVPRTLDLVHAQDLALADYGLLRTNEYYVSQYVDHTPLVHPTHGVILAARQNLAIGGRHPWVLIGSLAHGTSFATDALQFHGLTTRAGGAPIGLSRPSLPGQRRQHEHALAVIQDARLRLEPGASAALGFFAWFEPDHPGASSPDDLSLIAQALALPEAAPPRAIQTNGITPAATLFSARPLLAAREFDEEEITACFGAERRAAEREDGRLLSFFRSANAHVVLPAKERASLRPHGQILRTGDALVPEEAALTTTVWMGGTFHSMLTQGHVSSNRLLSTTRGYLGLFRSHGQRVFIEQDGGWQLLDLPTAFEMTPSGARWWYRHTGGLLELCSWAAIDRHELWLTARVLEGEPCRFLISNHIAVHGDDGADALPVRFTLDAHGVVVHFEPESDLGRRFPGGSFRIDPTVDTVLTRVGGDELLFEDGRSRDLPYVVIEIARAREFALRITGQLIGNAPAGEAQAQATEDAAAADRFWQHMTGRLALKGPENHPAAAAVAHLAEFLPWLSHDASIHYLAPRGLEQFTGGGWGTRDVCQGPVELLLGLGRTGPVRDLLLRVFRNQNPDGDWPQWFSFFERERNIRAGDSHGDIVFWPLLALGRYLLACEDATLLDEELPFFHSEGDAQAERATLLEHVERALSRIARRVIPGTRLAIYGNGDWNDAMQPVDRALAERLCSAWTVTLHYQMLMQLAAGLRRTGHAARAAELDAELPGIREEFNHALVADGVVTGLAQFHEGGRVGLWLHPQDCETGVHYSLLPMVHAILARLFTPEQAARHAALIRHHLLGADGARLFDRPLAYRGGPSQIFQRAESSSFFGREIGLMYTHAHLRYAEAMAELGEAEAFFLALQQANPIGLRELVPGARPRQANCYTTSNDADFADRYEAALRYGAVRTGDVGFEGGWRVYSSGAGILLRLVREHLLGVRLARTQLTLDPVLPRGLDGLRAVLDLYGHRVEICYSVGVLGYGPRGLVLNGTPLPFERVAHPYRAGGARVATDALRECLRAGLNLLHIELD